MDYTKGKYGVKMLDITLYIIPTLNYKKFLL